MTVVVTSAWGKGAEAMRQAGQQWDRDIREVRNEVMYTSQEPAANSDSPVDNVITEGTWAIETRWYDLTGNLATKFSGDAAKLEQTAKAYNDSEEEAEASAKFWTWKEK